MSEIGTADVSETAMAYEFMPGVNPNAFRDDHKLNVRFSKDVALNIAKSKAEKRPVYDEVTFVRIQVPGDNKNIIYEPLLTAEEVVGNPAHQKNYARRFPKQYEAFLKGVEQGDSGTPLAGWALINRAQIAEMRHFGVETVEQLAGIPDSLASRGMNWRARKNRPQGRLGPTHDTPHHPQIPAGRAARPATLTEQIAGKADKGRGK